MGTNHGGICVLVRQSIQTSVVDIPSYTLMELLALHVSVGSTVFVLVVIYRPASQALTDKFFNELSDVLERFSTHARLVVVGDVNVHLDDVTSAASMKLRTLFDSFDMTDHIHSLTHRQGHQLDIIAARHDQHVASVRIEPPVLSDHALIVATLDVLNAAEKSSTRHVLRRRWRSFDVTAFAADLQQSRLVAATPTDVDELFNCYDDTLRSLLNKHAPLCRSTVRCNPAAP
jgi:hypothetical protein